jgi:hypothetical protein
VSGELKGGKKGGSIDAEGLAAANRQPLHESSLEIQMNLEIEPGPALPG